MRLLFENIEQRQFLTRQKEVKSDYLQELNKSLIVMGNEVLKSYLLCLSLFMELLLLS